MVVALVAVAPDMASACSAIADDAERLACYDGQYRDVKLIRCTDIFGDANCEVLTPAANDMVSCVAMDKDRQVMARSVGVSGAGVTFLGLDAGQIASLDCQIMG